MTFHQLSTSHMALNTSVIPKNCAKMLIVVFDGVLRSGEREEILHRIPFEALAIGNLATPSEHNVTNQIWIQSNLGAKISVPGGIWYELGRPAKEYEKHWEAFEWLALLVKYMSDAIEICVRRKVKVKLTYFRQSFAEEMRQIHGNDATFQRWMNAFGRGTYNRGWI